MQKGVYTRIMSIFATATVAKPARTKESQRVAWVYAAVLAIMATTQIVGFSKFVLIIDSYWLPGGGRFAAFLAGFLIACELLAIPFLLRLKLSRAFRVFSMAIGWLVPALWLALTLDALLTTNALTNLGLLGGYIPVLPGWWAVFVSAALGILAAWASWGLWPTVTRKK